MEIAKGLFILSMFIVTAAILLNNWTTIRQEKLSFNWPTMAVTAIKKLWFLIIPENLILGPMWAPVAPKNTSKQESSPKGSIRSILALYATSTLYKKSE